VFAGPGLAPGFRSPPSDLAYHGPVTTAHPRGGDRPAPPGRARGRRARRWAAVLLALAVAATAPGRGFGASFLQRDFDQLVGEADEIFLGTVTRLESRKAASGAILTDVTFSEREVLKGPSGAGDFVLVVLGGTVGGETLAVPGLPAFELGLTYLVFVKGNGTTIFPVVGGPQGLFQVRRDPVTGARTVLDARGLPVRSPSVLGAVQAPTRGQAPLAPAPPIPLDAFVGAIRARLGSR